MVDHQKSNTYLHTSDVAASLFTPSPPEAISLHPGGGGGEEEERGGGGILAIRYITELAEERQRAPVSFFGIAFHMSFAQLSWIFPSKAISGQVTRLVQVVLPPKIVVIVLCTTVSKRSI